MESLRRFQLLKMPRPKTQEDIERTRAYHRKYARDHKDESRARQAKYIARNPDKVAESKRRYRLANSEKAHAYYLANAEKIKARVRTQSKSEHGRKLASERHAQRKERDENYRIIRKLRSSIGTTVKRYTGNRKAAKCVELLGCSIEFFRGWIEAQFKPGMTWANHGLRTWHIDHRIPCAKFDLREESQQRQCFNYTNLQPLWAIENLQKAAK